MLKIGACGVRDLHFEFDGALHENLLESCSNTTLRLDNGDIVRLSHSGKWNFNSAPWCMPLVGEIVQNKGIQNIAENQEGRCAFTFGEGNEKVRVRLQRTRQSGSKAYAYSLRFLDNTPPEIDDVFPLFNENNLAPSFLKHDFEDLFFGVRGLPTGFFIINGMAGSGKTTLASALLVKIARTYPIRIITVEDPAEYDMRSFVSDERNGFLGSLLQHDCTTSGYGFSDVLHMTLREDPDVLFIGEMRTPEALETALTAAETGHLVISTLHASSASFGLVISRLLGMLPDGFTPEGHAMRVSQALTGCFALDYRKGCGDIPRTGSMLRLLERPDEGMRKLIRDRTLQQIDAQYLIDWKCRARNEGLLSDQRKERR